MSIETDAIREALITLEGKLHPSDIYGHAELKEARSELDQLEQRSTALGRIVGHKPEQQWIPVSERLPETECDSKAYYVYATHKVFMPKTHLAAYCDGGFSFLDWDAWTVTHWMPLPAPPKETE